MSETLKFAQFGGKKIEKISSRDTTTECLAMFAQEKNAQERLSEFTGAPIHNTVHRWLYGNENRKPIKPNGAYLLRIRFFLQASGYAVEEVEKLDPTVRQFAKMVAFKIISEEEATKKLFYLSKSNLFAVLLGRQNTAPAKIEIMEQCISEYADALTKKMSDYGFISPKEKTKTRPIKTPAANQDEIYACLAKSFANLVEAMNPIASIILASFTPEERKQLRELTNGDGIFKLSNALSRMCSETANKELKTKAPITSDKKEKDDGKKE